MSVSVIEVIGTSPLYQIKIPATDTHTYAVYWSYQANKEVDVKHYIGKITYKHPSFEFHDEMKRRVYFQLVHENDVIVCAQRMVSVKGMLNFRDLGGYMNDEGKRIKWGLLYRSDCFSKLDDKSVEYVKALGLHTIIDLRRTEEIVKNPNKDIGSMNQINCNPNAVIASLAGDMQNMTEATSIVDIEKLGSMEYQQQQFVENETCKNAYSLALRILLNPTYAPLDLHCRGGKDRTGYGALLLLGVLGINEETILYDYMITKEVRRERSALLYKEFSSKYKDAEQLAYFYSLVDTKEVFLQASLDAIHRKYNSIKAYAMQELGITKTMIDFASAYYLE